MPCLQYTYTSKLLMLLETANGSKESKQLEQVRNCLNSLKIKRFAHQKLLETETA